MLRLVAALLAWLAAADAMHVGAPTGCMRASRAVSSPVMTVSSRRAFAAAAAGLALSQAGPANAVQLLGGKLDGVLAAPLGKPAGTIKNIEAATMEAQVAGKAAAKARAEAAEDAKLAREERLAAAKAAREVKAGKA